MTRHELADAMIKGLYANDVEECQTAYIYVAQGVCRCCPLGAALIGKHNGDYLEARMAVTNASRVFRDQDECLIISRLLGIHSDLAVEIENKHLNDMPIQQIAAWLKSSEGGEDVQ